jgi:hypothetical protein
MTSIFIAAFGGGVLRGLVGYIKYQFSYKEVKFRPRYFLGTMVLAGTVGAVATIAIKEIGLTLLGNFTPALAFIIGYAGGDFLENIYKIIIKKSSLFDESNQKN